ncbi:hypothetical protein GGR58DRAFT_295325 [Xylaria digitata]|nr:hypothetical protein GGR58DRAFT_295325 [Xylaria digitata]
MTTPLDRWFAGRQQPIRDLPLELALEVAEGLDTSEDLVNFSLVCPAFLDYWIHLTENIEKAKTNEEDPVPNPQMQLPPAQHGPIVPAGVSTFQRFSERAIERFFSPEIQRLIMVILFVPNGSHPIYDIGFRRNNPQVGDPNPFPVLFQRRLERFHSYYTRSEHRQLLFTFRALNRITPTASAIKKFATDFARKSLSADPSSAHHSFPSFVPKCNTPGRHYDLIRAAAVRDEEAWLQDLGQLREIEQQRLLLAFYQYEAVCATSAKINGYWEIHRAIETPVNGVRQNIGDWNAWRVHNSPLVNETSCQIERVASVYKYVRLQWLLIFHALWDEYTLRLEQAVAEAEAAGVHGSRSYWEDTRMSGTCPAVFYDKQQRLEMIDILCSRGLLFLHEVLSMTREQRRDFIVRTFYPVRSTLRELRRPEYLIEGIFETLGGQQTLDSDVYNDDLGNTSGQNLSWVAWNFHANMNGVISSKTADYCDDYVNSLRRTGYVFWDTERCRELALSHPAFMDALEFRNRPTSFLSCPGGYLDNPDSLNFSQGMAIPHEKILDVAWAKAREPFITPMPAPSLVEFGVLGETWRLGEYVDANQEPYLPDFRFGM